MGWRAESDRTVDLAKLAVETGIFTLLEFEDGALTINREPRFTPVRDYLKIQGRFRHLTDAQIAEIERWIKEKWERDRALAKALAPKPKPVPMPAK